MKTIQLCLFQGIKFFLAFSFLLISVMSEAQCPPSTGFTASDTIVCSGLPVTFNNTSMGVSLKYIWTFGDGTTSTASSPSHIFPDNVGGSFNYYHVTLLSTDTIHNCSSSFSMLIKVKQRPNTYYWQSSNFHICLPSIEALPIEVKVYNYSDTNTISHFTVNWDQGLGPQNVVTPFTMTTSISNFYTSTGYYHVEFSAVGLNGCVSSTIDTLSIISNPVAEFTPPISGTNVGCTPLTLSIINTSSNITPTTLTYITWGDYQVDSLPVGRLPGDTLYHTYSHPTCDSAGNNSAFMIRLSTINSCGSSYQVYYPISIYKKPVAVFALSADTTCANSPTTFINQSHPNFCAANPATFYYWDFGDGTQAGPILGTSINPTPNVSHTYLNPGVYYVKLTAANSSTYGCGTTDTTLKIVVVKTTANFNFTSNCAGVQIHFTDSSTTSGGPILSWLWQFGDGTTSTQQSPNHTYAVGGNYTVTLHVTGTSGCTSTISRLVIIYLKPSPNFSYTNTCLGTITQFTDMSSSTYPIISRLWKFGDGATSTLTNPSHQYNSSGTFVARLILTNSMGCTDSISKNVIIRQQPNAAFAITSSLSCASNMQVSFTSQSTTSNGVITSYLWNFGDGTPSATSQNPGHTYNNPGAYITTLIVGDQYGCLDTISHTNTVNPIPDAQFTFDTVCLGNPTHFSDISNLQGGSILYKWKWSFGDNSIDTIHQNPTHVYVAPGSHSVKFIVFNLNGCSDTITGNVWVDSLPSPAFTSDVVCRGVPTSFQESSITHGAPISQWNWTFGLNANATVQNPTHVFDTSGLINTVLKVTDNNGCSNQITQAVTVYPHPLANFSIVPSCLGQPTLLLDSTNGLGFPITSWFWDFGNGMTSTLQNPVTGYGMVGTYNIQLTVNNALNCISTVTKSFIFDSLPEIHFYADTVCANTPTHFTDASISHGSMNISWNWNFGDGSTSILQNPNHTFTSPGIHNVSLTVTNAKGCIDTLIQSVSVDTLPLPQFSVSPVCLYNSAQFIQTSMAFGGANISNLNWTFGDGSSSSMIQPTHQYSVSGSFNTILQVTDSKGCTAAISHTTTVYPLPVANFSSVNHCLGSLTTFSDSSNLAGGTLLNQTWSFGDGASTSNL